MNCNDRNLTFEEQQQWNLQLQSFTGENSSSSMLRWVNEVKIMTQLCFNSTKSTTVMAMLWMQQMRFPLILLTNCFNRSSLAPELVIGIEYLQEESRFEAKSWRKVWKSLKKIERILMIFLLDLRIVIVIRVSVSIKTLYLTLIHLLISIRQIGSN